MRLGADSSLPQVAIAVGDALRRAGIHAVLTGGACASVHSGGSYVSADVDFVLSGSITRSQLDAALASLGFRRRMDRYVHPRVPYYVEFPRGPLGVGSDVGVRPITLKRRAGRTLALSPTDSCRDRLAAFYHWNDRQSLAAATAIALRHRLGYGRIRRWSRAEGASARYEEFLAELRRARSGRGFAPSRSRPRR